MVNINEPTNDWDFMSPVTFIANIKTMGIALGMMGTAVIREASEYLDLASKLCTDFQDATEAAGYEITDDYNDMADADIMFTIPAAATNFVSEYTMKEIEYIRSQGHGDTADHTRSMIAPQMVAMLGATLEVEGKAIKGSLAEQVNETLGNDDDDGMTFLRGGLN